MVLELMAIGKNFGDSSQLNNEIIKSFNQLNRGRLAMPGTINEEIDKMSELLNAATSAPLTESASTDAPGTEAPGTDAPSTESVATDAPATESVATDAPTTEAPSEMDLLRAEIAELKALSKSKPKPATKAPGTSTPSTEAPILDEDFLGDIDLDELTRDPKSFNELLNKVFKKGIEVSKITSRSGNEQVLRSIPDIVKNNVALSVSLKKASESFYTENKDLEPFKKVVAVVFEEVAAENPDKTYSEILKTVGNETRKRLNLQKQAVKPDDRSTPRLPKRKGQQQQQRQQNKPDANPLLNELAEMDKSLNDY